MKIENYRRVMRVADAIHYFQIKTPRRIRKLTWSIATWATRKIEDIENKDAPAWRVAMREVLVPHNLDSLDVVVGVYDLVDLDMHLPFIMAQSRNVLTVELREDTAYRVVVNSGETRYAQDVPAVI